MQKTYAPVHDTEQQSSEQLSVIILTVLLRLDRRLDRQKNQLVSINLVN